MDTIQVNYSGGLQFFDFGPYSSDQSFELMTSAPASFYVWDQVTHKGVTNGTNVTEAVINLPGNGDSYRMYLTGKVPYLGPEGFWGDITGTGAFTGTIKDLSLDVPCAPVPEPASVAMMLIGVSVLWFKSRRMKTFAKFA